MIEALNNITQTWNQHCGVVSKSDREQYDRLLQRLMDVNPTSLSHRPFPAEAVIGKVDSGYPQVILASGSYTCNCPGFKNPPYIFNRRMPCKHLCVIAAHALLHFVRKK